MIRKYIGCADLHITDKTPKYRIDNYPVTGLGKLEWVVKQANENDATLLIAGDIFDYPTVSYEVVNKVIIILSACKYVPIAVAGQHDMVKRMEHIKNSALYNLHVSGKIKILFKGQYDSEHNIYAQPFSDSYPEIKNVTGRCPILLVHRSITPEEPPFFLSEAISSTDALKEYRDFKLIISGDYHVGFRKRKGTQHLINCGPMLREGKDKRNYAPCVWLIHIDNDKVDTVTQLSIPIEPAAKVFDLEAIEYDEKQVEVRLDTTKLAEMIKAGVNTLDFRAIVFTVYNSNSDEFKLLDKKDVNSILIGGQL